MNKLTQDIILILVVLAGIGSFFFNPMGENMDYLRMAMTGIIGFLIKTPITNRELPVARAFKK